MLLWNIEIFIFLFWFLIIQTNHNKILTIGSISKSIYFIRNFFDPELLKILLILVDSLHRISLSVKNYDQLYKCFSQLAFNFFFLLFKLLRGQFRAIFFVLNPSVIRSKLFHSVFLFSFKFENIFFLLLLLDFFHRFFLLKLLI